MAGNAVHKLIHKNISGTFVRIECKISYVFISKVKFSDDWKESCLKHKGISIEIDNVFNQYKKQ